MVYEWDQLDITTITNLFLYGHATPPNDKTNDALIRPNTPFPPPIEVNMASFMANGPGRFALGSRSPLIETFFSSALNLSWMQVGVQYTKATFIQELVNHGVTLPLASNFTIRQVELGDLSPDYWMRSYVWNNGEFDLSEFAAFTVDANGNRTIENYAIKPVGQENFDFVSERGQAWHIA